MRHPRAVEATAYVSALIFAVLGVNYLAEPAWVRGVGMLVMSALTAANGIRVRRLARR